MKRNWLFVFVCSVLLSMMFACTSFANEYDDEWTETNVITVYEANPLYEPLEKVSHIDVYEAAPTYLATPVYATDNGNVTELIREGMINRETVITVYYQSSQLFSDEEAEAWIGARFDDVFVESWDSRAGDYLRYSYQDYAALMTIYTDGTIYIYETTYVIQYYTTYEQEQSLDSMLENVLAELDVNHSGKTDYEKVCLIYDYVTSNVRYDYENLFNDAHTLKYTAYAALGNKTAVCQGYATLLYRMLEGCNIDCRVITGESFGAGHAWNIVKLNGQYYLLDATWDAGATEYAYFLKGLSNFQSHTFAEEFTQGTFTSTYPISSTDYSADYVTTESDFVFVLNPDGESYSVGAKDSSSIRGQLVIPTEYNGKPVTSIMELGFRDCSDLTGDLVIPDSITHIGDSAFSGCKRFDGNLVLPDSITSIGYGVFSGCEGFTGDLIIPDSVTSIGNFAFSYCTGFNGRLILPKKLTHIGWCAFSGCAGFTGTLIIPEGVTSIGDSAFIYCSGFTGDLVLPDSITEIGSSAFQECTGFTGDLRIPKGVTLILSSTFAGCDGFDGVLVIPDGVTEIRSGAFWGCSGLSGSLVLPEGLSIISSSAFRECTGFTGDLVIPNGVTHIEQAAFYECTGFVGNLVLPESLESIGMNAFTRNIGITDVTLSKNLSYIQDAAFSYCSNITDVWFDGAPIHKDFIRFNDNAELTSATWHYNTNPSFGDKEQIQSFVTRLYNECLLRDPEPAGLAVWSSRLYSGSLSGTGAAHGIVFSQEYKNRSLCNEDYVENLYNAFMGRKSDAGGKADWVGKLEAGVSREAVFNGFAMSKEFSNLCAEYGIVVGEAIDEPLQGTGATGKCTVCGKENGVNDGVTAFVTRLYTICLGRTPDVHGLEDWTTQLRNHTNTGRGVAYGFVFSREFTNMNLNNSEYVECLYKAFFDRPSDAGGKADWMNRLNMGWSREQVFDGFVGSQEFTNLCNKYGITRD